MPGKVDEHLWQKAKDIVTKEYGAQSSLGDEKFFKLVTSIYKNMGGDFNKQACLAAWNKVEAYRGKIRSY